LNTDNAPSPNNRVVDETPDHIASIDAPESAAPSAQPFGAIAAHVGLRGRDEHNDAIVDPWEATTAKNVQNVWSVVVSEE
jgi:hypothetical protein